jgi:hypothetical protein
MQEYDVALKLLLRGSAKLTMRELTGTSVETWLDVELSKVVQNTRVDLLGKPPKTRVSSTWNYRAATMPPCRYEWPSIAWECFGCSEDSHTKCCSTLEKRPCEWRANSGATTYGSDTVLSIFAI